MLAGVFDTYHRFPRDFYLDDTFRLVPKILGKLLVRRIGKKIVAGRIVEVEAYVGNDPASHAAKGMTSRNQVMFEAGGVAYVYFTYGMHYCFNIVTDRQGYPAALLVRALEPVAGIDLMRKRRKNRPFEELTNGPAKLCQALMIDRNQNGKLLDRPDLFLADDGFKIPRSAIISSTRIGIKSGTESEWRFYVRGNRFVSKLGRADR